MSRSLHTSKVVCQSCKYENLIDSPITPNGQPLQDWLCSQCDQKLFSVSFKKPAHPDTVPITCSHCKLKNKLHFGPSDISKQFTKWNCSSCKTELVNLSVQKVGTTANPWEAAQNTIRAKASASQINYNAKLIGNFARKNWSILIIIAVCLFVWANTNGNGSNSLSKNSRDSLIRSTENVYRGTKIAKQEFVKYSRSQRILIQRFLKENFGYGSTIDGLWGQRTAESFLRAANRYARGESLNSTRTVNNIFKVALEKKITNKKVQNQSSRSTSNAIQNRLGLTDNQFKTYNFMLSICPIGTGADKYGACVRNAFCQAKYGRDCEPTTKETTCYVYPGLGGLPDRVVCQ